jgi:hypothetical protein
VGICWAEIGAWYPDCIGDRLISCRSPFERSITKLTIER